MRVNLLNCFNKNQDKSSTPEVHLFSFVVINILTNMVNVLNNTISSFKSTFSTVTNGNNLLTIRHKKTFGVDLI